MAAPACDFALKILQNKKKRAASSRTSAARVDATKLRAISSTKDIDRRANSNCGTQVVFTGTRAAAAERGREFAAPRDGARVKVNYR